MRNKRTHMVVLGFFLSLIIVPSLFATENSENKHENSKIPLAEIKIAKRNITKVTLELKQAILGSDIIKLLSYIDKEGMRCTDSIIPFDEIERDLKDKNNSLYLSLFDTHQFMEQCNKGGNYPAGTLSDRDFFLKSKKLKITIDLLEPDWATVHIASVDKEYYPREWNFHRVGNDWRLEGGFIFDCACG
jgi:hypothetical protein